MFRTKGLPTFWDPHFDMTIGIRWLTGHWVFYWHEQWGAAAAKLLQSCPTVRPQRRQPTRLPCSWDSPGKNTGVGCHFLLQCVKVKSLSRVPLFATPWTAAYQAPPSMGFSRQEYWSGVPLPSPSYTPPVSMIVFLIFTILKVNNAYPTVDLFVFSYWIMMLSLFHVLVENSWIFFR